MLIKEMDAEWLIFLLVILAGVWPTRHWLRSMKWWSWIAAIGVIMIAIIGAKAWQSRTERALKSRESLLASTPNESRRDDYISSNQCQSCHPDEYHSWHVSYHRTMTQYASPKTILADLHGLELNARGEHYQFERRGDEYWVDMPDPDWKAEQAFRRNLKDWSSLTNAPRVTNRVSLVTGSHHQQKLWVPSRRGNMQFDLPFTYLIDDHQWALREETIVRDPHEPLLVQVWNWNCLKCHSTGPQPRRDSKSGEFTTQVAEMGIACEACHGPAEEHIRVNNDPNRRYKNHLDGDSDPTIVNPAKVSTSASSQICGQCHGMKLPLSDEWERSGFSYRPGDDLEATSVMVRPAHQSDQPWLDVALKLLRDDGLLDQFFWPDGQIRILREYNGMIESKCHSQGDLTCLSCHDMHSKESDLPSLKRWANDQLSPRGHDDAACLQCHESYRDRIQEHTHHSPGSAGAQCYNCHMPHTVWGLMKAVRSHQITSPSVQESVNFGRPNACNLCHLDQTLDWTSKVLNDWYGIPAPSLSEEQRTISATLLWALKGDAAQRAFISWHMGWQPARQASGEQWMPPFLAELLVDRYPAVRYRAHHSLQRISGFEDIDYNFAGPETEREQTREQVLERWRQNTERIEKTGAHLLIQSNGEPHQDTIRQLTAERDNRPIFLVE